MPTGGEGLDEPGPIVGVRFARQGPLQFVDPDDHPLVPGQVVVVEIEGHEALATVVVAPSQIAENEAGVVARGRVMRAATSGDLTTFGRRDAEAVGAIDRARARCQDLDVHASVIDALLAPDGARMTIVCDGSLEDPNMLAHDLEQVVGVPIDIAIAVGGEEPGRAASGVVAAGLPADWPNLLDPEATDVVVRSEDPVETSAAQFIERLYPPGHRFERPPRKGRH
ncbi:MAG: hypothetical protein HW416_34 [Chloroflexi bacterium]|nr:hypothetical protein [Chloroflexota bacterium]